MVYACGFDHAVEYAQNKRDRIKAKESARLHRIKKEAVRPLKWYADKAREACHGYIRERDKFDNCISCGRDHDGQYHAGHYKPSAVNALLRYNEQNIHKQCAPCNSHKSGNLTEYRKRLVIKIGEAAVIELEQNNEVKRWTKEELIEIRRHYQQKLKELRQ
jgi:hypothetical protein